MEPKLEFIQEGIAYALFRRPYGWAVYLRDPEGNLGERVGGYTEEELKEEFPEAFRPD